MSIISRIVVKYKDSSLLCHGGDTEKKFYNIDLLLNKCPTLMLQQSKVLYNWQMLDVQLSTNYLEMTMTTVARSNQDATAEARWQG
jgi:hypothetical protein